MKILITAGNTHAPIDRVRVITNVFTGKTGALLARTAWARGHRITVLTSQPYTLSDLPDPAEDTDRRAVVVPFQTYDDLAGRLQHEVRTGGYDCVIHSALVSDYLCAGVYTPDAGTFFSARTGRWEANGKPPTMTDHRGGKIPTAEPEFWLRLVKAPKLVDRIRTAWGFGGVLVKFRMEIGLGDVQLVESAEKSRAGSQADLMVVSTIEGANHFAYLGPVDGQYDRIDRRELAERLILAAEDVHRAKVRAEAQDG
jgi:phosphopantothenoylcysteine synthetase/decarboxylase